GGVGACAIDVQAGALASLRHRHHTRDQECQVREVAPVQRQIVDLLLYDDITLDSAAFGVEGRDFGSYAHRLGNGADSEHDVVSQRLADFEHDAGLLVRAKALHFGSEFVVPRRKVGDGKTSGVVGRYGPCNARIHIPDTDLDSR